MTIPEFFEKMPSQFYPAAAGDLQKTIQWTITGEEACVWAFHIEQGIGMLIPGGVEKPDVLFTVDSKVWLDIAEGRLDSTRAFMTGKLKVSGDLTLAIRVSEFFPADSAKAD
jgi:putative sterol carrier protein